MFNFFFKIYFYIKSIFTSNTKKMPYQPEIENECKIAYIQTLIKTRELSKDLEKMEFLSDALINPSLKFYAMPAKDLKRNNYEIVPVLQRKKKI